MYRDGTPGSVEPSGQPAEWATASSAVGCIACAAGRSARLNFIIVANLGFRPDRSGLHPRFYAIAALRGLMANPTDDQLDQTFLKLDPQSTKNKVPRFKGSY